MILGKERSISIPYNSPPSRFVQISVASSRPSSVFIIPRSSFELYKRNSQEVVCIAQSHLSTIHKFIVEISHSTSWNLIIKNPWTHKNEIHYQVTEMVPR